jgi:hypothetical protein
MQVANKQVPYAQAAYVAASLINRSAEELDSVRIWPLIEALVSSSDRVDEPRVCTSPEGPLVPHDSRHPQR